MKQFLFTILILPLLIPISFAQSKIAAFKELLQLMDQDSLTESVMKDYMPSNLPGIEDSGRNSKLNESVKSSFPAMNNIMKKLRTEDMVTLYDKYFTEKEINDYLTFYKSTSGVKWLSAQVKISRELSTIMKQKYMPAIMDSMKIKMGLNMII
jgi:uncharacterized protein